MPTQSMVLEGFITVEKEKTYLHLPFHVPAHTVRLDITFQYTDQIGSSPLLSGGNTIDLGVFDERGIEFLQAGFRGWSGSERDQFFLSELDATPGYLAGALNPGVWHLFLGLYKLAPQGCKYKAEILVTTNDLVADASIEKQVSADLPSSRPLEPFSPWLRGELHCHTWHSDGELSPDRLVGRAVERGMDFLAVTDHNTIAAQRVLEQIQDPGVLLIRGVESTTYKGHFNIWGIREWIDFRVQTPDQMKAVVQAANDLGGVTSCGHPKPFGPDWDFREVTNYQCVEVWNGPWSGLNEMALEYWLDLLANGMRRTAIGGSDFHRVGEGGGRDIGTPTTWVYLHETPTAPAILKAIQKGHVCLSAGPDGPFIELRGGKNYASMGGDACQFSTHEPFPFQVRCREGDGGKLLLYNQKGMVFEQIVSGSQALIEGKLTAAGSMFVRAELRDPDGRGRMLALTNPIYLGE